MIAGFIAAVIAVKLIFFRPKSVPVTVFRAARGRVEESVANSKSGTVKSPRRASLSPEAGGRVLEIPVRKGAKVKKGDVLLRLSDADLRAQLALQESALQAAQADVRQSCAEAALAERELRRNQELAKERIVSVQLLDQLRSRRDSVSAACEASRARVHQAEAAIEVARVNLEKTVLRAPFDGVVAEIKAELGEWITPSPPGIPMPAVLELIGDGSVYVSAPIDEVDVARVRVGLGARITLDAYPDRTFAGSVTRVAPYVQDVQEQNRTFEIEVEFALGQSPPDLRPGTSADVEVILDQRDDVLRIPSYALMEGSRVLVVRGSRLAARKVKTGLMNWAFAEIRGGLQPGEPVVVSLDRAEVRDGARARISAETLK